MDRLPLRECARRCEISLDTAFKWRHRLLDSLQKIHGAVRLAGVVEVDEVYFSISYKGSKKFPAQLAGREPKKTRDAFNKKRPVSGKGLRPHSRKPEWKKHRRRLQSRETHNRRSQGSLRLQDPCLLYACDRQAWRISFTG